MKRTSWTAILAKATTLLVVASLMLTIVVPALHEHTCLENDERVAYEDFVAAADECTVCDCIQQLKNHSFEFDLPTVAWPQAQAVIHYPTPIGYVVYIVHTSCFLNKAPPQA